MLNKRYANAKCLFTQTCNILLSQNVAVIVILRLAQESHYLSLFIRGILHCVQNDVIGYICLFHFNTSKASISH